MKAFRNWRDERGMTLVMVGLGFLAFMSATMLAVDVGMMMVARTQSQKAADAGALAGAVALVFDDWDDRTAAGPAVQSALVAARATNNDVINEQASVLPADVTFPAIDRIRVRVQRSTDRGNPVNLFLGPMINLDTADVGAVAMAEVVPADAATCLKPWAIPDKWDERRAPVDEANMFYETGPNKGQPLPNPDIFIDTHDEVNYTGYRPAKQGLDYGRQIVIKPGNPNMAINSSQFFPIRLPGGTGADYYEENIYDCWPGVAEIGHSMTVEPGNMTGPTTHGVEALIAKDPTATWDANKKDVVSNYRPSPRIVVIPVFDPYLYEKARQTGATDIVISNFVGFFIEELNGNTVTGRVVPNTGLVRSNNNNPGAFLKAIRLIE
jgi:Flp pilus assembly protein TadG